MGYMDCQEEQIAMAGKSNYFVSKKIMLWSSVTEITIQIQYGNMVTKQTNNCPKEKQEIFAKSSNTKRIPSGSQMHGDLLWENRRGSRTAVTLADTCEL